MDHKKLDAWKKAMDLVVQSYQVTSDYPDHEKFEIISQIRRAAVSIPSNIAEGAARNHDKEFLYISLGSLSELETLFLLSEKLKYIDQINTQYIITELVDIRKLILGLKNI